jgi:hypothetical protein
VAILDNAIWLTGSGGTSQDGSTVISDGANNTTVTATFLGTFEADPGGYTGVTDFGAFAVDTPTIATYEFSNVVENVNFDFNHVNDSGNTYDDMWTIRIYDDDGNLVPATDVLAAFSGLVDEAVYANPDGSVTLEAQGDIANDVNFNLTGYQISKMELTLEPGPGGAVSGGTGISDIAFDVVPDLDGDGVADADDIDIDGDGILNADEGYSETIPTTITITFDGDEYASGGETTWTLYDASGAVIATSGETSSSVTVTDIAVTDLGSYSFVVDDTFGEGLAGSDPASYSIAIDGQTIHTSAANENFGFQQTVDFDVLPIVLSTDTDEDGIADHLDLDSDNDGITDNVEAQTTAGYVAPTGVDTDDDGLDDAYDATPTTGAAGSDGLTAVDTDGDNTADYVDTDSDNDGIDDVDEAGHGVSQAAIDASGDADGDGIMDVVDAVDGFDANDADIDGSGNFTLADTDNDTAADGSDATPLVFDLDFRDNTPNDGTVSGTAGDDFIDASYVGDPDGDQVDSTDAILPGHQPNDDLIEAGAGNDTVVAGDGDDSVYGETGDDTIFGGVGSDTVFGGTGDDSITFSEGDDASGGTGDDLFVLEDLGEPENGTITIDGGSGNETTGDTLKIGTLGVLNQDVRDTFVDDGTGSYSGSIQLDDGTVLNFSEIENIICFTLGTRITTPRGLVAIEALKVGDLVFTRDHGLQPIRWIGARTVPAIDRFAPVRIRPNVLTGQDRDLLVSPQHRVLFNGYRAELLFGEREVLISAKHLVNGVDVTQDEQNHVTYVHMLFDQHEIIYAEGAATESFHPGDIGFSAVGDEAREELFAIFPELRSDPKQYGGTARRCMKEYEAKLIWS